MMGRKKNNISGQDVERLLDEAFLNLDFNDPKNARVLESMTTNVMMKDTYVVAHKKKKFKIKLTVLGLCITIAGLLAAFFVPKNINTPAITRSAPKTIDDSVGNSEDNNVTMYDQTEKDTRSQRAPVKKETNSPMLLIIDSSCVDRENDIDIPKYSEIVTYKNSSVETKVVNDTTYVFPRLTEKEIKANNKQKRKMVEAILKLSKKDYPSIPQRNAVSEDVSQYMLSHEVTNLEYRTFLFDLLIENDKTGFLKAKPYQGYWVNCTGTHTYDNFKDNYFSDKAFNAYPVVNISYEGAAMYCEWLGKSVQEVANQKSAKFSDITIRIPKMSEWKHAAKGGLSGSYPWGNDSIQSRKNLFFANFCAQKSKEKFNQPIVYPHNSDPNSFTTGGWALNNDTVATVMAFAYNPNNYGLYCMSGNVSEWVVTDETKQTKAIGGNWASDLEFLRIDSEEEFKKYPIASPFIGFRPIVIVKK
jgi:hypothetical protein